jgi:hypothetical protein
MENKKWYCALGLLLQCTWSSRLRNGPAHLGLSAQNQKQGTVFPFCRRWLHRPNLASQQRRAVQGVVGEDDGSMRNRLAVVGWWGAFRNDYATVRNSAAVKRTVVAQTGGCQQRRLARGRIADPCGACGTLGCTGERQEMVVDGKLHEEE